MDMAISLDNLFAANISVKELMAQANTGENAGNLDLGQLLGMDISTAQILETFSQTLAKKISVGEESDTIDISTEEEIAKTENLDIIIPQDQAALPAVLVQNVSTDIKVESQTDETSSELEIPSSGVEKTETRIQTEIPELPNQSESAIITAENNMPKAPILTEIESEPSAPSQVTAETPVTNAAQTVALANEDELEIQNNDAVAQNTALETTAQSVINKSAVADMNIENQAEIAAEQPIDAAVPQETSQNNTSEQIPNPQTSQENDSLTQAINFAPVVQKVNKDQIQETLKPIEKNNEKINVSAEIETGFNSDINSSAQIQNTQETAELRPPLNRETAASITSQIQESIYTSYNADSREVTIRLSPPELGKVAIKFSEENNEIQGVMHIDELHTKNQIQKELPEIIQNLQESGIAVKKIEVVLSNHQEQQTLKDQSTYSDQSGYSQQQQNASNPQPQKSGGIYSQWNAFAQSVSAIAEPIMQFSGTSVNMLA